MAFRCFYRTPLKTFLNAPEEYLLNSWEAFDGVGVDVIAGNFHFSFFFGGGGFLHFFLSFFVFVRFRSFLFGLLHH